METVAVSQAPAVSEASAAVVPPVGGATMAALPSAVQDLARFFLNLTGSSSLGAVGGVAGVAAPASGVGVQLCPLAPGGGAVAPCAATAIPAGVVDPPAAPAAVPGSSGLQQRQGISRPSRRRRRSSSDGTGRAQKKRPRGRSPSPGRSSRHRERSYRSSSDSSEDDRAETSPPMSGRAPGGTLVILAPLRRVTARPVLALRAGSRGHLQERSGIAQVLAVVCPPRLWAWRTTIVLVPLMLWTSTGMTLSGPSWPSSGTSTAWKSWRVFLQLDARLLLHRSYGLMSESSPAFHLPTSPLVRSLLDDTNLALSKFLEDQTVHGFLPVPSRRHRRYYRTSSSSFPGPYSVPPGVTSITLEKASEVKKRSVSLSASQVSSMETMLSGVCEVASWLDWWLSTCGGFRENLPIEVRADFERLILSGSRALEFLASQGTTALGNLVLSRRDSLLADVRSTVPVGGSCALEVLTSSRDGLSLPVSPAGLSVDQDACGGERRSCSTYPPSAQDSSEACGCWRVGWVVDFCFCAGGYL